MVSWHLVSSSLLKYVWPGSSHFLSQPQQQQQRTALFSLVLTAIWLPPSREGWNVCGSMKKETAMLLYVEELQQVSVCVSMGWEGSAPHFTAGWCGRATR